MGITFANLKAFGKYPIFKHALKILVKTEVALLGRCLIKMFTIPSIPGAFEFLRVLIID